MCVSKSDFTTGHFFAECFFDTVSSYLLVTYCLIDTSCASPTPLTGIRLNPCVTPLGDGPSVIWPIRSQTQVMSPSSASMSVASICRTTFRTETLVSSRRTTRRSPLPRTLTYFNIPEHEAAASSKNSSHCVGGLSFCCKSYWHQGNLCGHGSRNSCLKSSRVCVKGEERSRPKRCDNIERQATSPHNPGTES